MIVTKVLATQAQKRMQVFDAHNRRQVSGILSKEVITTYHAFVQVSSGDLERKFVELQECKHHNHFFSLST